MVNTPTSNSNDPWTKYMAVGIGVNLLIPFGGSGNRTWLLFLFHGPTALVDHGLLIAGVSRTHADTHITLHRTPLDE